MDSITIQPNGTVVVKRFESREDHIIRGTRWLYEHSENVRDAIRRRLGRPLRRSIDLTGYRIVNL